MEDFLRLHLCFNGDVRLQHVHPVLHNLYLVSWDVNCSDLGAQAASSLHVLLISVDD